MFILRLGLTALVGFAISFASTTTASHASPGSLSGPSVSISWDSKNWYQPAKDCADYLIRYSVTEANLIADVEMFHNTSKGPIIGTRLDGGLGESASGINTISICEDDLPKDKGKPIRVTILLKDQQSNRFGDGSQNIYTADVLLKSRNSNKAKRIKSVKCIKLSTERIKTFSGKWAERNECPRKWVRL